MIAATLDLGSLVGEMTSRLEEYRSRAASNLQHAGNIVREQEIQAKQLSGRDSRDMGLNIITGTGHDDWTTTTEVQGYTIETTISNHERSFYLRFHEDGAGYNPKRLVIEHGPTRDYAEAMYIEEATEALNLLGAA